jgi:hypothetical protein
MRWQRISLILEYTRLKHNEVEGLLANAPVDIRDVMSRQIAQLGSAIDGTAELRYVRKSASGMPDSHSMT